MQLALKTAILSNFGPRRQFLVAQKAGISESVLSRIVLGRRIPSQEEKRAIAGALDMDERELFSSVETG